MQVVKNMLTSDSYKGTDMKSFFVLLFPLVLVGCGEPSPEEDAIRQLGGEINSTSGEVTYITLANSFITDAGMEHLKGMTSLKSLDLSFTKKITDAGLAEIQAALPECDVIK